MKKIILYVVFAILVFGGMPLWSQDKAISVDKPAEAGKSVTPLRIQVVFTEYDGDKKISSLPYSLLVNSDDKGPKAAVRMGLRVPIVTGSQGSTVTPVTQVQYMDVGTSLDGRADKTEDGRFLLQLNVEKSSLYAPGTGQKPVSLGGNEISSLQPVVQSFRSQVNLLIRDNQTIQSTVATDQVTGHVLKVDVTLNVVK